MSGYVRLYRSLFGHPAFRNDAEAMAFAWMVGKASWQAASVRYKGHRLNLQRGQLAISQRDMADQMDRDKGWIERLWRRLKNEAMIEAEVKAGVAVITICNYDEYQPAKDTGKAVGKAREATPERQMQGTEQIREEVKGSEAKASSPKARFVLPADIPAEPWDGYEEMRGKIGHRLTDRARTIAINELRRLRDECGWPPGDVLNHCTLNGYRGIYPPKDSRHDRHQQSNPRPSNPTLDILRAANAELARSTDSQDNCGARLALPPTGTG